jgi:hypothetical protein
MGIFEERRRCHEIINIRSEEQEETNAIVESQIYR